MVPRVCVNNKTQCPAVVVAVAAAEMPRPAVVVAVVAGEMPRLAVAAVETPQLAVVVLRARVAE